MVEASASRMLAAASLRAAFQSAVEHVQSGALAGSADSQDTKLKFYALFKASASGTCKEKEPSSFDFVKHAKWSAWAGLGTITRADAMREYIALVRSLDAAWNPST
ncbi:ACBD6 [Symbiodinium sp. KB8]|nr:ACBD6 [Symbiodinium sp. KB8]